MRTAVFFLILLCTAFQSSAQPQYLDSTFNGTGLREDFTQSLPADYRAGYVKNLIAQPDGKTLALISLDSAAVVMRLLPNGNPDPGFAIAGRYLMEPAAPYTRLQAWSVALQADGKILITASENTSGQPGNNKIFIRLEATGILDAGFGTAGKALIPDSAFTPQKIMVRPNGKIVLASRWPIQQHALPRSKRAFSIYLFRETG